MVDKVEVTDKDKVLTTLHENTEKAYNVAKECGIINGKEIWPCDFYQLGKVVNETILKMMPFVSIQTSHSTLDYLYQMVTTFTSNSSIRNASMELKSHCYECTPQLLNEIEINDLYPTVDTIADTIVSRIFDKIINNILSKLDIHPVSYNTSIVKSQIYSHYEYIFHQTSRVDGFFILVPDNKKLLEFIFKDENPPVNERLLSNVSYRGKITTFDIDVYTTSILSNEVLIGRKSSHTNIDAGCFYLPHHLDPKSIAQAKVNPVNFYPIINPTMVQSIYWDEENGRKFYSGFRVNI